MVLYIFLSFRREHDKKVCCLGLTSLLSLPADQLPVEALGRIFRVTLELLVAYKEQVAGMSPSFSVISTNLWKKLPNVFYCFAVSDNLFLVNGFTYGRNCKGG